MKKTKLIILSIFIISIANADSIPLKKQNEIKDTVQECFGKFLKTKNENPMDVAYKFSGAKDVSPETDKQQQANLKIVLSNIMSSAPYKKAVDECCQKIFKDLDKYNQKDVLKTISYYVKLNDLQPLCPNQVNQLRLKAK